MKKTIINSIKTVLSQTSGGLPIDTIYTEIEKQKLYHFNAKNPKSVVNSEIRRHCYGLDFPSSYPVKHFYIAKWVGNKPLYDVIENLPPSYKDMKNFLNKNDADDLLPEEVVDKAIKNYNNVIKKILIEKIMKNEPSFFERLVVQLLIKMGYGYNESCGLVVGGSHDGGIDGIIREDKLGLDLIYIQAKRYSRENTVGRKELQAFIGAMEGVNKGVFFTTSDFTKEGKEYIKKIQSKKIKLIDCDTLLDYMIQYEVGVEPLKIYKILKIDDKYFL